MADKQQLLPEGSLDYSPTVAPSFKQRMMAIALSNASAREWLSKTRENVKPWSEFLNTKKFGAPKSIAPLPKRVIKNIEHFQGNYLFVFAGLFLFCILTSPMLLVALGVCAGACYMISVKNAAAKIAIMGKELSLAQQYGAVGAMSFPLFWLAGAGSAVFWVIGASMFVILAHAGLYMTPEELEGFDLELEEVTTI